VLDQFWHRAFVERYNGCAAKHRFGYAHAKWFGKVDGVQQGQGITQKLVTFIGTGGANVFYLVIQLRFNSFFKVVLILNNARYYSFLFAFFAISIASKGPLS
jgi:hypothetical protein